MATLNVLRSRLRAVSRACSDELGRYAIDGIHVREDGIVATDGKFMLEAPVTIDGDKGEVKRRILKAESVKMLLADKWTKKRGEAILESNGVFQATGTDIGAMPLNSYGPKDAEFPDTDGARVKDESVAFKVALNARLLAKIAAACIDVDGDSTSIIEFHFTKGADGKLSAVMPIGIRMGTDASRVTGVLMPCSI